MMRTTVSTQPQIIIVACCITLRRSAYDTAGNIRSITKDGTATKSFGYTNPSWPDLLTSVTANGTTKDVLYEGQSQTSDLPSSGNPVTYYNGKDYTFTWTKGRQLASATVDGKQVSYTYDMSGVRTSKTVNGTTYNYTTLSGKVMRQAWGNKSLEFVYDDGNQPFAMIYKHGQTTELYYYVLNAQGDVIALLNADGTLAASYNYGAWGNYSVHDDKGAKITKASFIGHINPLRYRGYYYDRETRLYYLQSRYYDFANCRFINADGQFTDGFIGSNLFAYCENNPIRYSDPTGLLAAEAAIAASNFWNPVGWIAAGLLVVEIGAIAVLSCGIASNVSQAMPKNKSTSKGGSANLSGFASGAASPSPPPPNKGGKGTKTSSKSFYNKDGVRIDVENPGDRQGQIHMHLKGKKYIYDISEKAFRFDKTGETAPRAVQKYLENEKIVIAIEKGLIILGY